MEMHYKYVNEDTDRVNLYESTILSIEKDDNKHEIKFIVDWTEGDPYVIVKCEKCSNLIINLSHNNRYEKKWIGTLEITGFSYIKKKDVYIVQFDFEHILSGYIRLECHNFIFLTPSKPINIGGNDNLIEEYGTISIE